MGSSTSSAGEMSRESVSQSPTVMVPSGRSAMICTVMPLADDTLTPHQAEAEALGHRLHDAGDARLDAGFGDHARFVQGIQLRGCRHVQHSFDQTGLAPKGAGPGGPTLKTIRSFEGDGGHIGASAPERNRRGLFPARSGLRRLRAEQPPVVRQHADAVALLGARLVGAHVDLDAVAAHADLDLEAAHRAVAALGNDPAGDAAGPRAEHIDVVRAEDQRARAVGAAGGGKVESAVVER